MLAGTSIIKECCLFAGTLEKHEGLVNLGDDADTIGAIAGGLAGLYYGYEKIPEEWLQAVVKREKLEEICRRADMFIKDNA